MFFYLVYPNQSRAHLNIASFPPYTWISTNFHYCLKKEQSDLEPGPCGEIHTCVIFVRCIFVFLARKINFIFSGTYSFGRCSRQESRLSSNLFASLVLFYLGFWNILLKDPFRLLGTFNIFWTRLCFWVFFMSLWSIIHFCIPLVWLENYVCSPVDACKSFFLYLSRISANFWTLKS